MPPHPPRNFSLFLPFLGSGIRYRNPTDLVICSRLSGRPSLLSRFEFFPPFPSLLAPFSPVHLLMYHLRQHVDLPFSLSFIGVAPQVYCFPSHPRVFLNQCQIRVEFVLPAPCPVHPSKWLSFLNRPPPSGRPPLLRLLRPPAPE